MVVTKSNVIGLLLCTCFSGDCNLSSEMRNSDLRQIYQMQRLLDVVSSARFSLTRTGQLTGNHMDKNDQSMVDDFGIHDRLLASSRKSIGKGLDGDGQETQREGTGHSGQCWVRGPVVEGGGHWSMAKMNPANRGIDVQIVHGDAFHNDRHTDLRAYSTPSAGNGNYFGVQHFIHRLAPTGLAGFVLANGPMSSNQSGDGDIRCERSDGLCSGGLCL